MPVAFQHLFFFVCWNESYGTLVPFYCTSHVRKRLQCWYYSNSMCVVQVGHHRLHLLTDRLSCILHFSLLYCHNMLGAGDSVVVVYGFQCLFRFSCYGQVPQCFLEHYRILYFMMVQILNSTLSALIYLN